MNIISNHRRAITFLWRMKTKRLRAKALLKNQVLSLSIVTVLAAFPCHQCVSQSQNPSNIFSTRGNPTSALATPDGQYVFVSLTNVDAPNFTGPDSAAGALQDVVSGIQVFRSRLGKLSPFKFVRIGGSGTNGLAFLPGTKTLVVGVGDDGVAFLDVDSLIRGDAVPTYANQGPKAGTFDVVVSKDGKYVFSANEYGVIDGQRGNLGITATNIDSSGRVRHPSSVGHIPLGETVPSLSISPDGSRIYVASELLPTDKTISISGLGNPLLAKADCVQRKDSPPKNGGYLSVIDTQKAIQGATDAVLARVASGCSPVRIVESADSSALYVSARGDNVVIEFAPEKLVEDQEHAFRRVIPTGGDSPVGIRLYDRDRKLAVANSNRFGTTPGTIALLNLQGQPKSIETMAAGQFPRNISASPDGKFLYVTNYTSRSVEVISLKNKH